MVVWVVSNKMKRINNGLILVTGKVNSGKSTTMNAFIQEINHEANKKIVMLEDRIEYEHNSDKSIIIQKEIATCHQNTENTCFRQDAG